MTNSKTAQLQNYFIQFIQTHGCGGFLTNNQQMLATVMPSAKNAGFWQVTYFKPTGPQANDVQCIHLEDAFKHIPQNATYVIPRELDSTMTSFIGINLPQACTDLSQEIPAQRTQVDQECKKISSDLFMETA